VNNLWDTATDAVISYLKGKVFAKTAKMKKNQIFTFNFSFFITFVLIILFRVVS